MPVLFTKVKTKAVAIPKKVYAPPTPTAPTSPPPGPLYVPRDTMPTYHELKKIERLGAPYRILLKDSKLLAPYLALNGCVPVNVWVGVNIKIDDTVEDLEIICLYKERGLLRETFVVIPDNQLISDSLFAEYRITHKITQGKVSKVEGVFPNPTLNRLQRETL